MLSVEFQKSPSFVHLITKVISSPLPQPPRPDWGCDIHAVFIFDDNSTCHHFHPFISSHASSFLNSLLNKILLVLQPHVKFIINSVCSRRYVLPFIIKINMLFLWRNYFQCDIYLYLSLSVKAEIISGSLLLLFSHSVVPNYLWPSWTAAHWLPCPSPSPGACSNSCPLSQWCHPTISSSVFPFFSNI